MKVKAIMEMLFVEAEAEAEKHSPLLASLIYILRILQIQPSSSKYLGNVLNLSSAAASASASTSASSSLALVGPFIPDPRSFFHFRF